MGTHHASLVDPHRRGGWASIRMQYWGCVLTHTCICVLLTSNKSIPLNGNTSLPVDPHRRGGHLQEYNKYWVLTHTCVLLTLNRSMGTHHASPVDPRRRGGHLLVKKTRLLPLRQPCINIPLHQPRTVFHFNRQYRIAETFRGRKRSLSAKFSSWIFMYHVHQACLRYRLYPRSFLREISVFSRFTKVFSLESFPFPVI